MIDPGWIVVGVVLLTFVVIYLITRREDRKSRSKDSVFDFIDFDGLD